MPTIIAIITMKPTNKRVILIIARPGFRCSKLQCYCCMLTKYSFFKKNYVIKSIVEKWQQWRLEIIKITMKVSNLEIISVNQRQFICWKYAWRGQFIILNCALFYVTQCVLNLRYDVIDYFWKGHINLHMRTKNQISIPCRLKISI